MREALDRSHLKTIYRRIAGRYDLQHRLLTAGADQRGRRLLVAHGVRGGETILDCGAGTGSTGIMALKMAGPGARLTLFDLSEAMLAVAREKVERGGLTEQVRYGVGDMTSLPFPDEVFDLVFSSYSLCPLGDPAKGALELYRVCRPGGRIAVGHSVEPRNALVRRAADWFEDLAWQWPSLSMGCRSVSVLPALLQAGVKILFQRRIGVPLWPFLVFVAEKPNP